MFTVAVTVIAAVVAVASAGLAAPSLIGRSLAIPELFAVAVPVAVLGWVLTAKHRRRERKRIMEMRDSALW